MNWTSTANPSFTTCCIQVIPNRNTEMCGAPSCWNHMEVRVAAVTCALSINLAKLVPRISGSVDQSGDQAECRVLLDDPLECPPIR
ncbi:hypothetical protein TNCV_2777971 [Trichonephila clavipes]|nr:hypothetical protein TNCV_2777971 [Trichonephila clavipes]